MNLDEMKLKIYPWIKVTLGNAPDGQSKEYHADLLMKPFLADLVIMFAVDMGNRFELLQQSHLPEGMTLDALYDIAVQNLADNVKFELTPTSYGGYGILADGDHEAGALCLSYIWEFCADKIGEDVVVAVPSKDMVLMVGESQPEELAQMKALASKIIEGGERMLTRNLFLYSKSEKRFSVYES
ncbi:MAG: DUF1444 family protein [Oscillospiraceae bacterium]|jgi:uncharacterized protein YtpQ (UPF0354 family)|nr:DUF1444 family protein [Oscillospiraceae bacterium]